MINGKNTIIHINIRKRLTFTKQEYYGQENLEPYVTLMVGVFQRVPKRYIW